MLRLGLPSSPQFVALMMRTEFGAAADATAATSAAAGGEAAAAVAAGARVVAPQPSPHPGRVSFNQFKRYARQREAQVEAAFR